MTLEYKQGEKSLDEISFKIKQGQKIGFVGRTGSGKSSILNAMFRLYDIQSGEIVFKGDINWKLEDIRKIIQVIP